MDSYDIKSFTFGKARSQKKPSQLRKMANLLRAIGLCIALLLISRFSSQLPLAVKNSSEYFRDFKVVILSPGFVFVLGNAIVFTLFAKSGQLFSHDSAITTNNIYNDLAEKSEVVVNQELGKIKTCKRFRPQNFSHRHRRTCQSGSQESRRIVDSGEDFEKDSLYHEDALSNEQFRMAIEAFIARQQKFQREEEFSAI